MRGLLCVAACSLVLHLSGCGSDGNRNYQEGPGYVPPDLSDLQMYNNASPYSEFLLDCVRAESPDNSCPLSVLPLLGHTSESPTVDEIMERVAVSHPWMGDRFRQVLEQLPEDLRTLMKGVTGRNSRGSADLNPAGE